MEIISGKGAERRLVDALRAEARRVLLVGAAGHPEGVERLTEALGDRVVGRILLEQAQVPAAVADAAVAEARALDVDWVVAHGGGTPIGVAKAVALSCPVKIAALPTTYAGSERTDIWGITRDGEKTTGRDPRVRPSRVAYDPELTANLPRTFAMESLYNALAHSVEALYAVERTAAALEAARASLPQLARGIRGLLVPGGADARAAAAEGAGLAGEALNGASMALQHKLAHVLSSGAGTPHAATHAALLPFTLAFNADETSLAPLRAAFATYDVAGWLWDRARDLGLATSLRTLGVERDALDALAEEATRRPYPNPRPFDRATLRALLEDAWLGRRPTTGSRRLEALSIDGPHAGPAPVELGAPLAEAHAAVLVVHGRGASAEGTLARLRRAVGASPGVAWVAPQADGASWYPSGFAEPVEANEPGFSSGLAALDALFERVGAHVPPERVLLAGFSQGACLALAWLATRGHPVARALAFSGALPPVEPGALASPVYVSRSAGDPWIPAEAFAATRGALERAGATVEAHTEPGDAHALHEADATALRAALDAVSAERPLSHGWGLGNQLGSEAEPGALPEDQNTPKPPPHGLFAEQINGTGFTVERASNRRTWLYRLRPQVPTKEWTPLNHARFTGRFEEALACPQIMRFRPPEPPDQAADFLDGLTTFAGAGDPTERRGAAVHLYAANRSMARAFCNVDGDLLLAPVSGRLRVQTELGWLAVRPEEILVMPRGLRFRVEVVDALATGFVAEVFDGHIELPERGPVGANGMASARHFRAPVAHYERRVGPFEVVVKQGGRLWQVEMPASPFDVVAWHGNYAPFAYDLRRFNSMGSVSFDHPDPSILTVLTCPMDTHGRNALDVAVFQGRWDPTEHTFRPPYFHRNSAVEFNGVLQSPSDTGPWVQGAFSWTPYLTPHGVSAVGHAGGLDAAETPMRLPDESLWIQFESTYPLKIMPWMVDHPARDDRYLDGFRGWRLGELA